MNSAGNHTILLVESTSDTTLKYVHTAAQDQKNVTSIYYTYSDLLKKAHPFPDLELETQNTAAFLAVPFMANDIETHYQAILQMILENYKFKKIMNFDMLSKGFMALEDKLYQSYLFEKNNFKYTQVKLPQKIGNVDFPLIARKRISSRSKNNFLITTPSELEKLSAENNLDKFLFQTYHELKGDYRVYVLGEKVVAVIKREVSIKKGNKIAVKVKEASNLPDHIIQDCIRLTKLIGADFLGIDIGETLGNEYFFIEYNGRAQIAAAQDALDLNIAKDILEYMLV